MYDYAGGKLDWLAAGFPTEGTNTQRTRAGDVARTDVATCRMDEYLADVRRRVVGADWDACVVVNQANVVMGLLREKELAGDGDRPIEQAMRPGPSTFRPHVPITELAALMVEHDLPNCPITTGDGTLIGLLVREDAVRAAHQEHEGHEG